MADKRTEPTGEIPEADLLEQQAPFDPQDLTPTEARHIIDEVSTEGLVDEADLLEQTMPVPGDEEDYAHDPAEQG